MRRMMILAALPLLAGACESKWERQGSVQASGKRVARSYDFKDFTSVELVGPDDVKVVQGPGFSVRAEGDSAALDLLEIEQRGSVLHVSRKSGFRWHGDDGDVLVTVTLPRLVAASNTGPGDMDIARGEGDFRAELTGPGDLRIGTLAGGKVDLKLTGPGDIEIGGGTASRLDAAVMGPGNILAEKLTASSADVSITGPGDVRATVKGPASVSIMGPGNAVLGGGAQCSVSRMGPGEARCS